RPPLRSGSGDRDYGVLRSGAALRDAGAEVLISGRSIIHTGAVEGHSLIGADLPVYRTQDLDLTRTLPGLTRWWRRLRGKPAATPANAAPPAPAPAATATERPASSTPATQPAPPRPTNASPS